MVPDPTLTSTAPPAIRTLPSWSRVAVCSLRGVVMLPVAVNARDCAIATEPCPANKQSEKTKPAFIEPPRKSLHTNADGVARPAKVGQAHGDGESRNHAARYPEVDLAVPRIAGGAEI